MNILFSVFADGWGGLEKYPLTLYEGLKKRGHKVWILTIKGTKLEKACKEKEIPCYTVDNRKKINFKTIKTIRSIVKENRIELIHANTSREIYNLKLALLGLDPKLILTFHIGVPNHKEPIHSFLYKRVKEIIAISKVEMNQMFERIPVPKEKINLLYNGVDISKFNRDEIEKKGFRSKLRIPEDSRMFLTIGNLSKGKGILEWIEASKRLVKKYDNLYLVWVGDDSHIDEDYTLETLRADIEKEGLSSKIILAGYQTDVTSILKEADLFVLPAHKESFGIVYIEAMLMGLPVIACNSGGAKEIVKDEINGYLCEPKNSEDLEKSLNKAYEKIEELKIIGEENIEYAKSFSMDNHIDNLIKIYNK